MLNDAEILHRLHHTFSTCARLAFPSKEDVFIPCAKATLQGRPGRHNRGTRCSTAMLALIFHLGSLECHDPSRYVKHTFLSYPPERSQGRGLWSCTVRFHLPATMGATGRSRPAEDQSRAFLCYSRQAGGELWHQTAWVFPNFQTHGMLRQVHSLMFKVETLPRPKEEREGWNLDHFGSCSLHNSGPGLTRVQALASGKLNISTYIYIYLYIYIYITISISICIYCISISISTTISLYLYLIYVYIYLYIYNILKQTCL